MTPADLPPALILDLDDTILDDSRASDECWERIAARHAREAGASAMDLFAAIERARVWYWEDDARARVGRVDLPAARRAVVMEALARVENHDAALAERIAADYVALRDSVFRPFPGALETVRRLHGRGIRLGLITNGAAAPQRAKVERLKLARYVSVIVIEGEFGCGKPDERVYHHALAGLSATPQDTWMVGDSLRNDVLAPQRLGLTGVWVNTDGRPLPPDAPGRPDRIIRALSELG